MTKNLNENISRVKSLMSLLNEDTETTPTPEGGQQYPTINNFSAIADDIYQDLITNKIQGVKIKSSSNQSLGSDNKTLESINFILDINGVEFLATFSKNGLSLFDNNSKKQVKPIWTDKILKYRPLNSTEKKSKNKWKKSQVELSLEEQLKLLKKQFQELYLL